MPGTKQLRDGGCVPHVVEISEIMWKFAVTMVYSDVTDRTLSNQRLGQTTDGLD